MCSQEAMDRATVRDLSNYQRDYNYTTFYQKSQDNLIQPCFRENSTIKYLKFLPHSLSDQVALHIIHIQTYKHTCIYSYIGIYIYEYFIYIHIKCTHRHTAYEFHSKIWSLLVGLLRGENFTFKNKECYLSGNYITQVTDSLRGFPLIKCPFCPSRGRMHQNLRNKDTEDLCLIIIVPNYHFKRQLIIHINSKKTVAKFQSLKILLSPPCSLFPNFQAIFLLYSCISLYFLHMKPQNV